MNPDQSEYTFGTPETGMASTTAATSKAVEVVDTSVEYLRQIVSDQNTHLLLFDGVIDAYTTKVDDNTKAINTVQLTLNSVTGELTSKVSKDDLVSTINQTAGAVKISANCIDLDGYVTAKELSAMKADVSWLKGLTVDVGILRTGTLSAGIASLDAVTANVLILGGTSAAPHTLKIGESSCTFFAPEDATFELSDMPGYDDALAAAKSEGASSVHVQALEIAGQNYHSSSKYIEVNLDTTLSNGSTEEGLLSVNASSAYNAGASDVAISEITCVDISAGADTGRVRVVVKLSNGKTRQQVFTLS